MKIEQGGLMRCCIATLLEKEEQLKDAKEGDEIKCFFCAGDMIFHNNFWKWKVPKP